MVSLDYIAVSCLKKENDQVWNRTAIAEILTSLPGIIRQIKVCALELTLKTRLALNSQRSTCLGLKACATTPNSEGFSVEISFYFRKYSHEKTDTDKVSEQRIVWF